MNIKHMLKKIIPKSLRSMIRSVFCLFRRFLLTMCYKVGILRTMKFSYYGLNLGCGNSRIEGFLNVDACFNTRCDVVANINKINLANGKVSNIYCSHALEHVSHKRCMDVLKSWAKLLGNGGRLYLAVPDVEVLFNMYLNYLPLYDDEQYRSIVDDTISIIYGGHTNPYNYHFNGLSFTTLAKMLKDAGFYSVERFLRDDCCDFELPQDASGAIRQGQLVSLNVVATKL